ncbi:MAG: hypothetical protein EOO09_14885 [Chitinophagaceae bacterium]|nr:MAG: hypothetical protein EOO09_14885 [Chitinophagaceae bacterium]
MKKIILMFSLVLSGFLSQAAVPVPLVAPGKLAFIQNNLKAYPECTFSVSATLNIVGQEASVTCSSSQTTCEAAINDVVRCIKTAKTRLQHALGF